MNRGADLKKLEAKIDEINQIRANFQKKYLILRHNIRKLLTDDQKAWFDQRDCRCFAMGQGYSDFSGRGLVWGGNNGGVWGRSRISGGWW